MADKEYIERGALIAEIDEQIGYIGFTSPYEDEISSIVHGLESARDTVEDAPAVDVVEVRRGRWLPQRLLGEDVVDCSECKTLGSPRWNWCPVCGADMRGNNDDSRTEN